MNEGPLGTQPIGVLSADGATDWVTVVPGRRYTVEGNETIGGGYWWVEKRLEVTDLYGAAGYAYGVFQDPDGGYMGVTAAGDGFEFNAGGATGIRCHLLGATTPQVYFHLREIPAG